ncbi:MAG: Fumarate reductase iron-sulfur subunit [Candidatus Anoxychlamydiales bacterium]|nr:Fumarate reductase iron-sulfur subunit [Candidatus Anoxychlamydiales bacterium]NGX35184.1 Fumarate reductase iron-sulfur subunit [Candidatus Anoxychlamydiales bacterium]
MKYILKVYRGTSQKQYFEKFELKYIEGSNVISALLEIQKNPVNKMGKKVAPISFEMSCLEEVCGACSMLINGYPRQACTALIKPLIEKTKTIVLAPLSKFHLIRDLVVNRSKMFEQLKKVKAWIDINDIDPESFGVKIDPAKRDALYILSKCMTCGCCLEACPQYNNRSNFIGPQAISQINLFNNHPLGKNIKDERFLNLVKDGGVSDCGNAQNCKEVCPQDIDLVEAIAKASKDTTKHLFKSLFPRKKK